MNVVVIGASLNPRRYAFHTVKLLNEKGHKVFAVGLQTGKIDDVEIATSLGEPKNVDTVTLYINPSIQPEYYQQIIEMKPKRVIFNPGSENTELVNLLKANRIDYTFSCTLIMLRTDTF